MRTILATIFFTLLTGCGDAYFGPGSLPGPRGLPGPAGENGQDGSDGQNGEDGQDGTNGTGCTITSVAPGGVAPYGGALITCATGSVLLVNGAPGAQGPIGPNGLPGPAGSPAPAVPYQITEIIDPCGNAPGIYDEVLLRIGSIILASFSDNANGQNTRFSIIVSGNYVTTDGSNCHFSVNGDQTVTW